jgi:hypothetical protein
MTKSLRSVTTAMILVAIGVMGSNLSSPAHAEDVTRTFYVSSTGSDAANGLSAATAWKSLAAVNKVAFRNGDMLRLQGGATFTGPLYFDAADGSVDVGSFGSGRATVLGKGTPAVQGYDAEGLTIHDLNLVGDAAAFADKGGLSLYSDQPAGTRLTGITISKVDVRGFKNGVEIGGKNPTAGFAQVRITDVRAHHNRDAGIITYGPAFNAAAPSFAHYDVRVLRSRADNNLGDAANTTRNTGNGIVLGSVSSGSIISSVAYGNGAMCRAPEGPVGIWAYDSRGIRIAYSKSYNNRTGGKADGGGFDLDQNVSKSLLERNNSSGNDGPGFLIFTAQSNSANTGNVVRYNTSTGDARKNGWYGGITVAGKVLRASIYGNTVNTSGSASHAPAISVKAGASGVTVSGNTLTAASGYNVVNSPGLSRSAAAFTSNRWSTAAQRVWWSKSYTSVAAWRTATGQS